MGDRQKKPHCCTVEGCNSSFSRPYRLAQHLLSHNNIKAYVCHEDNCSKSYTSRSHLERHVNNAHRDYRSEEVIYSCPICLKIYANRQNLKRHIKIHHYLKLPFTCGNCNMEFKKKHQLSTHMYRHTGIRAFSCEVCPKEFITLIDKKKHMRCHLNKTYECPGAECMLKFNKWTMLQKHMKTDHAVKEYICDSCGRNFKHRSHMVRHVKVHDETKSFQCPYENCKRLYSRNSNLKQHLLMKHECITHACKICNAQLCTKVKLNEHLLKCHNSEPEAKKIRTKATGRKSRKDIGVLKISTALKLAGLPKTLENDPRKNIEINVA